MLYVSKTPTYLFIIREPEMCYKSYCTSLFNSAIIQWIYTSKSRYRNNEYLKKMVSV